MATPQQLMEAITRSKSVDSRLGIKPVTSSARGRNIMDNGSDFDQFFTVSSTPAASVAPRNVNNSRLPREIVDSITNHPINANPLDELVDQEKPINEQTAIRFHHYTPQANTQNGGNGMGIDYSIIKAIVNECLNEYFKKPLNESVGTLSGIGLKEGKIKLVDNKGNIFSASLEYQGSTKKKQD